MKRRYPLVQPAIDPGRGRTRELLDELLEQWRRGGNEGAGEICAVIEALSDAEALPYAFKPIEGGTAAAFLQEFVQFLTPAAPVAHPGLARILHERKEDSLRVEAAGVGSATGALHAVLQALGVSGGEVVTTSLNYVGVINAILLAGARPRFVDIDPATWCMDPESARAAVGSETRAVLLTHLNHLVDLTPYYDLCEQGGRRLPLVQDASLAIASQDRGLKPGLLNIGRPGATVMSLTISKILSGMGGAVVTSDSRALVERVQAIANQGLNPYNEDALEDVGANYKLSVVNASIARAMLRRMAPIVERRRALRQRFEEALAPLRAEGLVTFQQLSPDDVATHFGILLPRGVDRKQLANTLSTNHGIAAGRWHTLHQEEAVRRRLAKEAPALPVTEEIGPRLLFLPFSAGLSDEDARFICEKASSEIRTAAMRG